MLTTQAIAGVPRMEIVYKPIDWFREYIRNPRKNDTVVDRMCASILEFGFAVPMLCRSSGEVVDGHLRYKSAKKLGIQELPVVLCDHWTEGQVRAFRLMVNRSVTWAEWDETALALELQEIQDMEFDLSLTGFEDEELARLLDSGAAAEGLTDEDSVPPLQGAAISKAGDLWLLGDHKLLVGDAAKMDDVERPFEELCFLEGILEDSEDGKIQRDLTREESDAVAASKRALEFECKHAGFSSFAEFQRWDHRSRRLQA